MTLQRQVGLASLIMMASVFLSRVIGLGREMVIAWIGGADGRVDAYQVAFVIPEILNHLLASGFLSVTFIPIFSGYLARNREDEGWRVLSVILTVLGLAMLALIALAMAAAPLLIEWLAPGMTAVDLRSSAVTMTRIIIPAQFFFFAGGLFMAVQFAKGQFVIPALAPLVYNGGIILGGALLASRIGMAGFSWGVLAGAFLGNFVIQWYGASRAGMRWRICFDIRHPDLITYIRLSLPLMLGLTMTFSTEVFLKYFGSYLPQGSIAALTYDLRLTFVLVGFFGQAVGTASFPFLARLAAERRMDEMNDLLNSTLRYLALVIPFSTVVMVLRHEAVMLLFQRGRFDPAATELTASVLPYLMMGTVAFATQTVVVRGFYAMQNTLFPALFSSVAVILSLPIYLFAMNAMGVQGVALAVSLSAILQVVLLFEAWHRRCRNPGRLSLYVHYLKIMAVSLSLGAGLEAFRRWWVAYVASPTHLGGLMTCIVIGLLFAAGLMVALRLCRIPELSVIAGRVKKRFIR